RRVAGDLLAEMLLEGIVGEFQPLLRPVRPEVAIHRAMNRLAVFVQAGAPGVVPQPAPVGLLLEADDLGNLGPLDPGRLERAQLRKARWPRPDDRNPLLHSDLRVGFPGNPCPLPWAEA